MDQPGHSYLDVEEEDDVSPLIPYSTPHANLHHTPHSPSQYHTPHSPSQYHTPHSQVGPTQYHTPYVGPNPLNNMSSNTTNVVELQPMANQQPSIVEVPRPQANDHLWVTIALIFLCFMLGCNWIGVLCLIPGLFCAAMGADYNKEGNKTQARSCGTMACIYNLVIVVIHIGAYIICIISAAIAVTVIFTRTKDTIDDVSDVINIGNDIRNGINSAVTSFP